MTVPGPAGRKILSPENRETLSSRHSRTPFPFRSLERSDRFHASIIPPNGRSFLVPQWKHAPASEADADGPRRSFDSAFEGTGWQGMTGMGRNDRVWVGRVGAPLGNVFIPAKPELGLTAGRFITKDTTNPQRTRRDLRLGSEPVVPVVTPL